MNKKRKLRKIEKFYILLLILIALLVIFILFARFSWYASVPAYAQSYSHEKNENTVQNEINDIKQDDYNIFEIINNNSKNIKKEEILKEEEDLEFTTVYKNNNKLPKGTIQVVQEGRDGKQETITKKFYEGDILVNEVINSNILIASVNKVVEIGTAGFSSDYKVKVGEKLFVTSNTLAVRLMPDKDSNKIITLSKNEEVKLLEIANDWYKIKYKNYEGYVQKDCVTYINPNVDISKYSSQKSKEELLASLSKNMSLNKPSGLSIEQFKKVLSGINQDKNKIFESNAEYFFYAEKQYKINGVFVAAVAIHESNWATSKIALNKKNLFGYGANDNNPYANAKTFSSYSEGIDLVSRVLVKYYINAPGTNIYDGEIANGKYYNGSTLSDVNKRYASDKNWNSGVYKWMSYLYNRL